MLAPGSCARLRPPRRPHADARLRSDARGRDVGVRQKLAAGELGPGMPHMFEKMSVSERIRLAKEKTKRVVDHLHYLLELHENNAIVLYTSTLSQQIPESFAANAFNVFQQGMHQFEIVRLCVLWDSAVIEKDNITTIIELIVHP